MGKSHVGPTVLNCRPPNFMRPDYSSTNCLIYSDFKDRFISYYLKGEILGIRLMKFASAPELSRVSKCRSKTHDGKRARYFADTMNVIQRDTSAEGA